LQAGVDGSSPFVSAISELGETRPYWFKRRASRGDAPCAAAVLAEAFNFLFKAQVVGNLGPWRSIDDLELAIADYVEWCNHRRLYGEIGVTLATRQRRRVHRDMRPKPTDPA